MKKVILTFLFSTFLISSSFAADTNYFLKVKIDGLACPFCAYGLEKKLKDYEGIQNLKIMVDEGFATFHYPYGKIPDIDDLKKRVKKGGFTPRDISIQIQGTAKKVQNTLFLFMNGLGSSFLLSGKTEGIQEGQKIMVEGLLSKQQLKGHADHPLAIDVKTWKKV